MFLALFFSCLKSNIQHLWGKGSEICSCKQQLFITLDHLSTPTSFTRYPSLSLFALILRSSLFSLNALLFTLYSLRLTLYSSLFTFTPEPLHFYPCSCFSFFAFLCPLFSLLLALFSLYVFSPFPLFESFLITFLSLLSSLHSSLFHLHSLLGLHPQSLPISHPP